MDKRTKIKLGTEKLKKEFNWTKSDEMIALSEMVRWGSRVSELNTPQALKESGISKILKFIDKVSVSEKSQYVVEALYFDIDPLSFQTDHPRVDFLFKRGKGLTMADLIEHYEELKPYLKKKSKEGGVWAERTIAFMELAKSCGYKPDTLQSCSIRKIADVFIIADYHKRKAELRKKDAKGQMQIMEFPCEQMQSIFSSCDALQNRLEKGKNKTNVISRILQKMSQKDM